MTAATTVATPTPATTPVHVSTFDQIKDGALKAVNWMGRQVQWLGNSIKDFVFRIYEWAKPFFQSVARMTTEFYEKGREFVLKNKEVTMLTVAAVIIAAAAAIGGYFMCCENTTKTPAKA